ncbi:hypothetical protein HKX48_001237 [Thoreauomyces humboldtii]|nr:hypothetical protein HKX48_001237 [Thoreauomyces humboldtii]
MNVPDAVDAVADVTEVLASLPLAGQLDLVEMLVLRASGELSEADAAQINAKDGRPQSENYGNNVWDQIALAIESARETSERSAYDSVSPGNGRHLSQVSGLHVFDGTVTMYLPDEIRPIALILHKLQHSKAAHLFADAKAPESAAHPFTLVKDNVLEILLQSPAILLRSSSLPSSATPVMSPKHPPRSSSWPEKTSSPITRVLTASSSLASLIEAIVSAHNDQILNSLNDQEALEEYQQTSESVWQATSGILRDVKKLKEGMPPGGSWGQAQHLYAHLVHTSMQFATGLEAFVRFATDTIRVSSTSTAVSPTGQSLAISPTSLPQSPTDDVTPSAYGSSAGDRHSKQKSPN